MRRRYFQSGCTLVFAMMALGSSCGGFQSSSVEGKVKTKDVNSKLSSEEEFHLSAQDQPCVSRNREHAACFAASGSVLVGTTHRGHRRTPLLQLEFAAGSLGEFGIRFRVC